MARVEGTPEPTRIRFLDGLRALAILLATASHAPYAGAGAADGWFARQGDFGVRVFFVISGFLITTLLVDELRTTGAIRVLEFWKRRAFRLTPVYFAYLGVVAAFAALGRYHDAPMSWIGALTYTRNVVGAGGSLTRHFWSLSIEEQFYLVWPLLLLALARRGPAALPLFIAAAAPLAMAFRFIQVGIDTRLHLILGAQSILMYYDALLAGAFVACLRTSGVRGPRGAPAGALRAAVAGALLATGLVAGSPPWLDFLQAGMMGAYLWLLLGAPSRLEAALWENPVAVYLGRISYSLYVWHFLFLGFFNHGLFGPLQPFVERHWPVCALLTAVASFHGLERPMREYLNARFASPRRSLASRDWKAAAVVAESS